MFQDFWDEARDITTDAESCAYINGVKAQMERLDFLFGLCLGECVMRHTDNLSKTLQSPSLSAADSQVLARLICTTLERIRNDESFALCGVKYPLCKRHIRYMMQNYLADARPHDAFWLALDKAHIQHRCKIIFVQNIFKQSILPWLVSSSTLTSLGIRRIVSWRGFLHQQLLVLIMQKISASSLTLIRRYSARNWNCLSPSSSQHSFMPPLLEYTRSSSTFAASPLVSVSAFHKCASFLICFWSCQPRMLSASGVHQL